MSNGNGQTPEVIQPAPVPLTVNVSAVMVGAERHVVLQLHTFTGVGVYFLPADFARQVARLLQDNAGGIVIAAPPFPEGGLQP